MPDTRLPFDASAPKRATNVSINSDLLEQARAMGINVSRACERGLADQITELRHKCWLEENREALDSSNAYVEAHGLPLARHRPC
ncbi:type II toxin-antitoxin system CcdA family antitoxin [Azospirillum picis]|uniref:Antitoxin CcdA n=1 Tax=Azospirillum picis TaxID=488438 RepID=A0ABU0MHW8_9PROT|nr:type II toxin-antitoxin system CcdA family antitoxin [Azospirillum picis]MBP2299344.1 antitoxin CcdA [Azospirillum picis]MDQ0533018.1 antitoxin CcdA [Azospirillum picis]